MARGANKEGLTPAPPVDEFQFVRLRFCCRGRFFEFHCSQLSFTMDPEAFLELANQVTKLKMYPYFDIAHYVISCLYMREDLSAGEF